MKQRTNLALLVIIAALVLDQTIKIWVKLHLTLGQELLPLGVSWCRIHFTENPGMAFGLAYGGDMGKLVLSLFRIVAIIGLGYYLRMLVRAEMHKGLIACVALIVAGAAGNILDSVFYGVLFSESGSFVKAALLPSAGGYAPFLHGRVVDMFYFPLYEGALPSWLPFVGGRYEQFFPYIFNFADACISVGVFAVLIFQRTFFATAPTSAADTETAREATVVEETHAEAEQAAEG